MLGAKMETIDGQPPKKRRTTAKERMAEVNTDAHSEWMLVYSEVNDFKHDPQGRIFGRVVTMKDAVTAFEQTLALLNKGSATLKARCP